MRYFLLIISLLVFNTINGQENCESYKYYGDTLKYKACKKVEVAQKIYQFYGIFQQKLDEAIKIDSTYAYAYREKSVAYLKSGDFITWKKLIDKAVRYDPKDNLGYRAWCRYQFFRDYKGAIKDIEKLDNLVDYDIGMSVNGDYHLNITKAICFNAIGEKDKSIEIIENQLNNKDHSVGLYDYFHLGVWYLEDNQFKKALIAFEKQLTENDLAEVHYYMALTYKKLNEFTNYEEELLIANKMYDEGKVLFDAYTHHYNKIFLSDIKNEMLNFENDKKK